ncbi:MAG: hypothetical protein IJ228_01170 [Succinivibrio sp.]|nr:hypothetical protein [Succinivibrio sp.]
MWMFLFSFLFFVLFAGALALGMLRKRPLKTEDQAMAEIMEGMSCASCNSALCGYAGDKSHKIDEHCERVAQSIPHRQV